MRAPLHELAVAAALVLAVYASASPAGAQPEPPAGTLDVTFAGDGSATTRIGITTDDGRAVAIQDDGRIVVAGASTHAGLGTLFTVVRFYPDGSLDPTFGGDGVVTTAFGGSTRNEANAVALDPAGRIVVAGETHVPHGAGTITHAAVARFLPDGSLDATFGGDGTVDTPLEARDAARAVAVQPDGRIVVAGISSPFTNGGGWMMVARYQDDGSLDPTFGHADPVLGPCDDDSGLQPGVVRTTIGSSSVAHAIELTPDGRVVVAGRAQSFNADIVVARYQPDGHPDASFGGAGTTCPGITLTDLTDDVGTSNDAAVAMDLMADGRVVVTGTSQHSSRGARAVLVRYTGGGLVDGSFGNAGIVLAPSGIAQGNAMAVDGDGRPIIAGDAHNGSNFDLRVLRYAVDGTLDPAFGAGGAVTTQVSSGDDRVRGMALQPDGRIVVVGFATNDLAAVRYLGDPPPPPTGCECRARVQQTRDSLAARLPTGDGHDDQATQLAIDALDRALDPSLWLDAHTLAATGSDEVFDELRTAVKALAKVTTMDVSADAAALGVTAQALTEEAVADAADAITAADGGDPTELADAQRALDDAEMRLSEGDARLDDAATPHAINSYAKAWLSAQDAIAHAAAA